MRKKETAALEKWLKRRDCKRQELAAVEADPTKPYIQQAPIERLKTAHTVLQRTQNFLTPDCHLGGAKPYQDTPLNILFTMIEQGEYPPPELLLMLLDGWKEYLSASGDLSLEEALIGSPSQGAGNYAARFRDEQALYALDFAMTVADAPRFDPITGNSYHLRYRQVDIAEKFDTSGEGAADSLLTRWRRWKKNRKTRANIKQAADKTGDK